MCLVDQATSTCRASLNLATLLRGHWHDFVMHAKWSSDPNVGFLEMWIDGVNVLPMYRAPNKYPGMRNYLLVGLYRNGHIGDPNLVYPNGTRVYASNDGTPGVAYVDGFIAGYTRESVEPPVTASQPPPDQSGDAPAPGPAPNPNSPSSSTPASAFASGGGCASSGAQTAGLRRSGGALPGVEQVPVERHHPLHVAIHSETPLCPLATHPAQARGESGILNEPVHRARQRFRRTLGDDDAGLADQVGHGAGARHHHGRLGSHAFDDGQAEGFLVLRWNHHDVRRGDELLDVVAQPEEMHAVRDAQMHDEILPIGQPRTFARDGQMRSLGEVRHGPQERLDALLRVEPRHADHQRSVTQGEFGAHSPPPTPPKRVRSIPFSTMTTRSGATA